MEVVAEGYTGRVAPCVCHWLEKNGLPLILESHGSAWLLGELGRAEGSREGRIGGLGMTSKALGTCWNPHLAALSSSEHRTLLSPSQSCCTGCQGLGPPESPNKTPAGDCSVKDSRARPPPHSPAWQTVAMCLSFPKWHLLSLHLGHKGMNELERKKQQKVQSEQHAWYFQRNYQQETEL